jgi:hypothetical protein
MRNDFDALMEKYRENEHETKRFTELLSSLNQEKQELTEYMRQVNSDIQTVRHSN